MTNLTYLGFNRLQTGQINYAYFLLEFTDEEMDCLTRPEYPACLMSQIIALFEADDSFTAKMFQTDCKPYIDFDRFTVDQICVILEGFEAGLSQDKVAFYAKSEFNDLQMMELQDAFCRGLTIQEVSQFAKSDLSPKEMAYEKYTILAQKNTP